MAFQAHVFRVIIASPDDVQAEREIIARTIAQWNDERAAETRAVLLPLRWETHSTPDYGKHPQDLLNEQLVEKADMLIGVFWTRIGSPTSEFPSGTVEEIEKAARTAKPVMLYFSRMKQSPDQIDLDQLQRLRNFKEHVKPLSLIEHFSDQAELRDKLMRHLSERAKQLVTEAKGDTRSDEANEVTIEFADPESGDAIGDRITTVSHTVAVLDEDEIPDFSPSDGMNNKSDNRPWNMSNKDYYRESVAYLKQQRLFQPLRFLLTNRGYWGAQNLFVELRFYSDGNDFKLGARENLRSPPSKDDLISFSRWSPRNQGTTIRKFEKGEPSWLVSFELPALQPTRELAPDWAIAIAATKDCEISIEAKIYADMLAEPVEHSLTISLRAIKSEVQAQQFIEELLLLGSPNK